MGIVKMEILEKLKKKEGYRVHSFQRSEFFSSKRRGGGERERKRSGHGGFVAASVRTQVRVGA